jgi:hypothetical protein
VFVCKTWGAGESRHTVLSSKRGRNAQWLCYFDVFGEICADSTPKDAAPTTVGMGADETSPTQLWDKSVELVSVPMKIEKARKKEAGEKTVVLTFTTKDQLARAGGGDCSYRCASLLHQVSDAAVKTNHAC